MNRFATFMLIFWTIALFLSVAYLPDDSFVPADINPSRGTPVGEAGGLKSASQPRGFD